MKMEEFTFCSIATSNQYFSFFVQYCTSKHSSPLIDHFCRDFMEISMFVIPTLLFSVIFDLSHLFQKERHLFSCLNQCCMILCCDSSKWQVFLWALHQQNSKQRQGYRHTPAGLAAPNSNVQEMRQAQFLQEQMKHEETKSVCRMFLLAENHQTFICITQTLLQQ